MSSVETIKEKLDITDVVGSYVKLEKAGANFKARCPFHHEKTPSFLVSPSRGTYYCFGCGAKGDIFTFVQEFEGVDFVTALKELAVRAGVNLDDYPRNTKEDSEKKKLLDILEVATKFFEEQLKGNTEAKAYLTRRGLVPETVDKWRVGYAADEWRVLFDHFKGLGYNEKDLERAGLIKQKNSDWYDVFRGRVMFPIFNPSGEVIAFSGRILKDTPNAPKYLNSPETLLFVKSETLYGLDKAKMAIRKKDYAILVEGQMDLLVAHQAGFDNTVASSGTAFTETHLVKLQKLSNRLMLAFDADKAGFTAALKSATLALALGMEVKVVGMPKGTDPAELIQTDIDAWKEALRNAKHVIDFHLDTLIRETKDKRTLGKEIEKKILPYLTLLTSAIEQSHFVSEIAKKTGLREDSIWADLKRLPRMKLQIPESSGTQTAPSSVSKEPRLPRKHFIERKLAGLLMVKNDSLDEEIAKLEDSLSAIHANYQKEIIERFTNEKDELVFETEQYYESNPSKREIAELLSNLEIDILKEQYAEAQMALREAEREKDEAKVAELLKKCQALSSELTRVQEKARAG